MNQAAFGLSSFSPMVNFHSVKQRILWDNKTSTEKPICEELGRMLLMSGVLCFLDWSQGCQGSMCSLPSDVPSNSVLSASMNSCSSCPRNASVLLSSYCCFLSLSSVELVNCIPCFQALNKYL